MFDIGDMIDDVEIVARLRAGGMAALYLGRRKGTGGFSKDIAIKAIHTHLSSDQSFVEMFVDEARLSARIDHPNVVRVEALKEHKHNHCLLMEFVHGCSLSQLMGALKKRDTRFSPELAVAIAIRVADGLHAAHELLNPDGTHAGVVHRDVSPANVLVGYRGDVKLIDFGIAKATQRLHQTEAAGLKGKIAYMSPEQAFGYDVDRRTDVYALGILLWEMLAMRRLFKADNDLRLLDMVRDPKVVPPGAIVPDLPPELDRVILDTLAKDRDQRPESARELRYRLLDALPSAAAIDPLQISAVVCDVMSEKILEDQEMLSLSSFNVLPMPSDKESVTVSRLLRPVSKDIEVSIDDLGRSAESLAGGYQAASQRESPPTILPQGTEELFTPTGAPRKRRMLPLALGIAAGLGLAAGGSVGLVYAVLGPDEGTAHAEEAVSLPLQGSEGEEGPAAPPSTPPEAPPIAVAQAGEPTPDPGGDSAGDEATANGTAGDEPMGEQAEADLAAGDSDTDVEPEEPAAVATSRRTRRTRRRGSTAVVQPPQPLPDNDPPPTTRGGGGGGGRRVTKIISGTAF